MSGPDIKPPTVKRAGDPRGKQATWTMIGQTPPGTCSQCAIEHDPDQPHNPQSVHYQYAFYAEHDRWPTWADAMAHCTLEVKRLWTDALAEHGITV